jgi:regulatory protein
MPSAPERAYVAGLKLLAARELAEAQVRERLLRRQFSPDEVDAAVARLRDERAIDDRRTAHAFARTEALVRGRGRLRVLRRLQAMGISPEVARTAVGDAFGDMNESERIGQVITRRLRPGETLADPRVAARLHRYLLAQGFPAGDVTSVISRQRHGASRDVEPE